MSAKVAVPTSATMKVTPAQIKDSTGLLVPPKTKTPTNAAAANESNRNEVREGFFLAMFRVYFDEAGVAAATPS